MKILITDDDSLKLNEIVEFVVSLGVERHQIRTATNVVEFHREFDSSVTICVIDLRLPSFEGGAVDQNGIGILQTIDRTGGDDVGLIAVSSYPDEFDSVRAKFESRGCIISNYQNPDVWKSALKQMVIQRQSREKFDFIIFCALQSERQPYTAMPELNGKAKSRGNLTRYDIEIAGKHGSVIELPRMGIVDAAVTAGICIERFAPAIVAMSGICAGFPDRSALGQLLISELAYEYQSGKWSDDGFSQEPYQIPISETMRTLVRDIIDDPDLVRQLEGNWRTARPSEQTLPKLCSFTSGSAVIASDAYLNQIAERHRKVSGLDMEVYALHRAAHLSKGKPEVVCAKVVVDLAGKEKDDKIHAYGSSISARFIVKLLESHFKAVKSI